MADSMTNLTQLFPWLTLDSPFIANQDTHHLPNEVSTTIPSTSWSPSKTTAWLEERKRRYPTLGKVAVAKEYDEEHKRQYRAALAESKRIIRATLPESTRIRRKAKNERGKERRRARMALDKNSNKKRGGKQKRERMMLKQAQAGIPVPSGGDTEMSAHVVHDLEEVGAAAAPFGRAMTSSVDKTASTPSKASSATASILTTTFKASAVSPPVSSASRASVASPGEHSRVDIRDVIDVDDYHATSRGLTSCMHDEEEEVDFGDYDAEMDEEFMRALQESAPDEEKLGSDYKDDDEDDTSGIEEEQDDDGHNEQLLLPDDSEDLMAAVASTIRDATALLKSLSTPDTPPKISRPPRTLSHEAHHFGHSHAFFSNGSWVHTISSRREYTRDVYDYLRAKGFSTKAIRHEIDVRLKHAWVDKFGPTGWTSQVTGVDDDESSAFGDEEIDDSDSILDRLETHKRKWDQTEGSGTSGSGSDKTDSVEGPETPRKRRKSVTFAKNVKKDDGTQVLKSTFFLHPIEDLQRNEPESYLEQQLQNFDKAEREIEVTSPKQRDEERRRRREMRKKIQRDFKKMKAANWVAELHSAQVDNEDIPDGVATEDNVPGLPVDTPASAFNKMQAIQAQPPNSHAHRGSTSEIDEGEELFDGYNRAHSAIGGSNNEIEATGNADDVVDTTSADGNDVEQIEAQIWDSLLTSPSKKKAPKDKRKKQGEQEELVLPNAADSTSPSPHRALKSRIDELCESMKSKAAEYMGQQSEENAGEKAKEKKRKRRSSSRDEERTIINTEEGDLKARMANIEDGENAHKTEKKQKKKRKSKSDNNDTSLHLSKDPTSSLWEFLSSPSVPANLDSTAVPCVAAPSTPPRQSSISSESSPLSSAQSDISDILSPFSSPPSSPTILFDELALPYTEYTPSPTKRPSQSSKSPYFPELKASQPTSCLPFQPLSAPSFGLVQETLRHDPFRLLLATIFLNRTRGGQAIPVFYKVMERYPTPSAMAEAQRSDIVAMIHGLGFQNQRAKKCIELAKVWLDCPPQNSKRYRKIHYPVKGDGVDVPADEAIEDEDTRIGWEIAHLSGLGPYALDSWRIFCRDELRGHARDLKRDGGVEGFEPEWKRVLPKDKELRAYLTWMWLKEGCVWNPVTGVRERASQEVMERAERGGVGVEGEMGWVVHGDVD